MTAPKPKQPSKGHPSTQLNLDTLQKDAVEPFAFIYHGERYVCADPRDLDFARLSAMDSDQVGELMDMLLPDKWQQLLDEGIEIWRVHALLQAVLAHYGITPGSEELGNSDAS